MWDRNATRCGSVVRACGEQDEVGRDGENGWWGKGTPGGWHHPEPREAMHCIVTRRQSLPLLDVAWIQQRLFMSGPWTKRKTFVVTMYKSLGRHEFIMQFERKGLG